jgi:hypothetical protein
MSYIASPYEYVPTDAERAELAQSDQVAGAIYAQLRGVASPSSDNYHSGTFARAYMQYRSDRYTGEAGLADAGSGHSAAIAQMASRAIALSQGHRAA